MRWERLFDDLEAQLELDERREQEAEVADRTRRERAQVDLQARLLANVGVTVSLRLPAPPGSTGPEVVTGTVGDVGPDWLTLEVARDRSLLVALGAVRAVTGLRDGAAPASVVARRLGLGAALRAVSRDRAAVAVTDVDGVVTTGTIDVVGADHLELAVHAHDEPRRSANLVARTLVPLAAIVSVRRPA
ncbi:hypothetical protein DFJ68_1979 [Terracoccus luteus]|uniref:Uncharacterized protein n=1 Tax=Terracoccus luteus TaxID=53356 RepID=A0A495XX52_9MICO|nr:hypothetical protein [Terracoccus luteus]RKT78532.1 hypothetical protein DFJ68_1979 [Terracoccus luteus]